MSIVMRPFQYTFAAAGILVMLVTSVLADPFEQGRAAWNGKCVGRLRLEAPMNGTRDLKAEAEAPTSRSIRGIQPISPY
jgi:hypothetical protein